MINYSRLYPIYLIIIIIVEKQQNTKVHKFRMSPNTLEIHDRIFSGSYNCGLNLCLRKHKVQERGSEQNDTTKKGKIHLVFHYCHAEHQVDNYVFRDFIIVMAYSPNAIVPPKNAQRLLLQNFLCLQKCTMPLILVYNSYCASTK